MDSNQLPQGRIRRAVSELVMAEMFLVQATIESATAIGDGFEELGDVERSWGDISALIKRTASEAAEPYSSRYRYFREMVESED